MLPADESLERADLIALEIYDRLVVNLELVPDKRPAQIGLHKAARLHLRIHLRFEEAQRAAPPRPDPRIPPPFEETAPAPPPHSWRGRAQGRRCATAGPDLVHQ